MEATPGGVWVSVLIGSILGVVGLLFVLGAAVTLGVVVTLKLLRKLRRKS